MVSEIMKSAAFTAFQIHQERPRVPTSQVFLVLEKQLMSR